MEKVSVKFDMIDMLDRIGKSLIETYAIYKDEPELTGYGSEDSYTIDMEYNNVDEDTFIDHMIQVYESELSMMKVEIEKGEK